MEKFWELMDSLADRLCERRAYQCLAHLLPAYLAPNGLTDGWMQCRDGLKNTQAQCRETMTPEEWRDLEHATAILESVLKNR